MIVLKKRYLSLLCLATLSGLGLAAPSHAASLISEGHAAGAQCGASGVNDSGVAVGDCTPGNGTGPVVAWVATTAGTETSLPALVSGQPCSDNAVTDAGVIVGVCSNGSNNTFAVTWSASSPTTPPSKLAPLALGVLGLSIGDVSSNATGYNQNGGVIGVSISAAANGTAVLWPAGSTTPVPVSSAGDNCVPVDVNATLVNGYPTIVLNCPNPTVQGTVIARYAQYGLLGYAMTALAIPTGYSFCSVSGINDSGQIIGTCHTVAPDHPNTVFWPSPAGTPALLSLSGNPRNSGGFINSLGDFTFNYQTTNGNAGSGVLILSTNTAYEMPASACGGAHVAISGLGDNEAAALNCEDGAENVEAGEWTVSGGAVAVGFEGGGQVSVLTMISKSGNYVAGSAENSAATNDAVVTSFP